MTEITKGFSSNSVQFLIEGKPSKVVNLLDTQANVSAFTTKVNLKS